MLRSPITSIDHELSPQEIHHNEELIRLLFAGQQFSELLNFQTPRDGDQNPDFLRAMEANAAVLNIHPINITIDANNYLQTLSNMLAENRIIINQEILANKEKARSLRNQLFKYFRAILFMHAVTRDAEIIAHSNIDHTNKAYANEKKIALLNTAHRQMHNFHNLANTNQSILIAKTPGNGDCFYHSVMLNIIHDALTGTLQDNTPTAEAIKTNLLPAISRQMLRVGGPQLDFTNKPIKLSILDLLHAAPIHAIAGHQHIAPAVNANDSEEVAAIKQCDMYHLLRDVCAPAERLVMQTGANHPAVTQAVKETLRDEFVSHIISKHGEDLGYSAVARAAFHAGEAFSDIPKASIEPMQNSWENTYARNQTAPDNAVYINPAESDEVKSASLNGLFNQWWEPHQAIAIETYMSFHTAPNLSAGKPQQIALSEVLHCNLQLIDKNNGEVHPLIQELPIDDEENIFLLHNPQGHYDARLGDLNADEPSVIAEVLEERMQTFIDHSASLLNVNFPWAAAIPDVDSPLIEEPVTIDSVVQSIEETKQLIEESRATLTTYTDQLTELQKNIILAADTGYKNALNNTLFGKNLENIKSIETIAQTLDVKVKQEADDFLLAVKLQNEEIEKLFRPRR